MKIKGLILMLSLHYPTAITNYVKEKIVYTGGSLPTKLAVAYLQNWR